MLLKELVAKATRPGFVAIVILVAVMLGVAEDMAHTPEPLPMPFGAMADFQYAWR